MELKTSVSVRSWPTVNSIESSFGSKGSGDGQMEQPNSLSISQSEIFISDSVRFIPICYFVYVMPSAGIEMHSCVRY